MNGVRGGLVVLTAAAAAAALVLAGAAPATSLLPSQKAALQLVARARAADRIDPATAASARAEIARAAHLVRALPQGRGYHVAVALSEVAAFPGALTEPRALALFGQLKANDDYFAKHWAPADKTDITGDDGVVYRYFAGADFRFHPLANFGALNALVAEGDADGTRTLADALLARGVYQRGGGLGWEYYFSFGGGRPPWLSGMAQAVAAQALARAAGLVTDESAAYRKAAAAAFRAIPNRLLTRVAAGPWIRLYAFDSTPVLNAQLQATISLQAYAAATGDASAATLAARMQSAAAATLPRFDTGYWSYYALPHDPSPVDYHEYVVQLLRRLAPADPRFADAAKRFAAYEQQPPAFRLRTAGVGQVSFWLSKPASVRVDTGAGPSKRLSLLEGWHTLDWGRPKQPGIYPVHVSASDWLGNRTSFDALPIVSVGGKAPPTRTTAAAAVEGQPAFLVGAAVDDPGQGALAQQLGLRLTRIGVAWPAGATAPDPGLLAALQRLPAGMAALVELNAGTPSADPAVQSALAQYAAALVQQTPAIRQLVLTPAPTAAVTTQYAATLGAVRDAVHAVSPQTQVGPLVDGSLAPRGTVAALGRALAATGHAAPYADLVAFRPAADTTGGAWTQPNVAQLAKAFGGTTPPIVIDGIAVAAAVPPAQAGAYAPETPLTGATPADQAKAYASAIAAAACSPQIAGIVFDRLADTPAVPVPPTGLYYASGAAKPSAAAVSAAAGPAQRGSTVCPGLTTPAAASTLVFPTSVTSSVPVSFQLGCVRDCLYLATLVGADGRPVVALRGALQGGAAPATLRLPRTTLGQASYRLDVRLVTQVNPGPVTELQSDPLPRS